MDRKQMIDDLERKLREMDERLEAKEEQVKALGDEKRAAYERKRAELKEQRARLKARLETARDSAKDGWERTANELGEAWKSFKDTAERVTSSLRG